MQTATLTTDTRTNRSWDNGDFICLPDMGFATFAENEGAYDDAMALSAYPAAVRRAAVLGYAGRTSLNGRQLAALAYFAGCATDAEAALHHELQFTELA